MASPSNVGPHATSQILWSMVVGVFFGMALEKAKLILPEVIVAQMKMQGFQMLKAFLTASAVGGFVFALLYHTGLAGRQIRPKTCLGFNVLRGYSANIVGGILVGVGMTIAGSCPGTVFAQFGAGMSSAKYVLLGGLIGGFLYSLMHYLLNFFIKFGQLGDKVALDIHLKLPFWMLSVLMGSFLLLIVAAVEYFVPWMGDIVHSFTDTTTMVDPAVSWFSVRQFTWPPVLSGLILGLVQMPSVLATGAVLGTSTSYVTVARGLCEWVDARVGRKLFSRFTTQEQNWLQVFFTIGIVLGAFVSVSASGFVYPETRLTPLRSFVGGIVLVVGSRIAGGCTSGHGLSGMGQLSVSSLFTTMAMFGGGMLTALFV